MENPRQTLLQELNEAVQRNGNQTVLFTNAISQRIGLSATEFECFSLLMDRGPLSAGELAATCGLSTGGVTGLVDRLEKAEFVRRISDPSDRRKVMIESRRDEATMQKIRELYEPVRELFDEFTQTYSNDELRVVIDFLDRGHSMIGTLLREMRHL